MADGYIPVVASVASDGKGQGLNVNADTAAGEVSGMQAGRVLPKRLGGGLIRRLDESTLF